MAQEGEKTPHMSSFTFHLTLLGYSDKDVIYICNFQSSIHNPHRFCLFHIYQPQTRRVVCLCSHSIFFVYYLFSKSPYITKMMHRI